MAKTPKISTSRVDTTEGSWAGATLQEPCLGDGPTGWRAQEATGWRWSGCGWDWNEEIRWGQISNTRCSPKNHQVCLLRNPTCKRLPHRKPMVIQTEADGTCCDTQTWALQEPICRDFCFSVLPAHPTLVPYLLRKEGTAGEGQTTPSKVLRSRLSFLFFTFEGESGQKRELWFWHELGFKM